MQNPTPPAALKGIQINVPGTNVNVDPKGGVKVEAARRESGNRRQGREGRGRRMEVELPKVKIESK